MTASTKGLSIGELEAGFPAYCQALRRLVSLGRDLDTIQRTLCWDYLKRFQGGANHASVASNPNPFSFK